MYYITKNKLFEFFKETVNCCGSFLLNLTDEEIGYNIFEVFDINVRTFFHDDNINVLLSNNLITKKVYYQAQIIRKRFLEIENTDEWSVVGVRGSVRWRDIMNLCDSIREDMKVI